eukprot:g678.t1
MSEAPRLSSLLRLFLSQPDSAVDTTSAFLSRQEKLRRRPRRSSSKSSSGAFRWPAIADHMRGAAHGGAAEELRTMRTKFREFITACGEIGGNEGESGTQAAALCLYDTITGGKTALSESELALTFGVIPKAIFKRCEALAREIHTWLGGARPWEASSGRGSSSASSSARSSSAAAAAAETKRSDGLVLRGGREFGAGEHFSLPAADAGDEGLGSLNFGGAASGGAGGADPWAFDEEVKFDGGAGGLHPPSLSSSPAQEDMTHPATWLYGQAVEHLSNSPGQAAVMTPQDVGKAILEVLRGSKRGGGAPSAGDMQARLFDLLGAEGLGLMEALLDRRAVLAAVRDEDLDAAAAGEPLGGGGGGGGGGDSSSHLTKRERKLERRQKRDGVRVQGMSSSVSRPGAGGGPGGAAGGAGGAGGAAADPLVASGFDPAYLQQERALGLQKNRGGAGAGGGGRVFESKLDMTRALESLGSHEAKRTLPVGTKRTVKKGYEEIYVPAAKAAAGEDRLVPVTEFDEFAQLAFGNTKSLNRMQSRLYEPAYHSNENLLVCAPTGAGKTNVAMMTVLRALKNHMEGGVIQRDQVKIIYVAPMKALAQEVVTNFGRRLKPLQIVVKELTGDMQLTKREIEQTQMIVTTPEKWDVVTRKSGDGSLTSLVKLLIIDEVHLLADERGSVIESIVARTLRQVESTQSVIRIVGLSATLPNYEDVGQFLRVHPHRGLFHFDGSFRPVPLEQRFIGVTELNDVKQRLMMNEIAYEKALQSVRSGYQVMVFVHTRKGTANTAQALRELAAKNNTLGVFSTADHKMHGLRARDVAKSRNHDVKDLYAAGFGIHHAGMLRADRNLTESLFGQGLVKVLCCTATLAWGVNLPAHTVIIKGTDVYSAKHGGIKQLGVLDVQQIFGRAGRPQFEKSGEGIIITAHANLGRYLAMLTRQVPIESQFLSRLPDNLNAEIVSGTVANVREAVAWLSYTYLYVRMMRNPLAYGIPWDEREADPTLEQRRRELIHGAAKRLDECRMARFVRSSDQLAVTHLGRVASHYYIINESVELFNGTLFPHMADQDMLQLIAESKELENIQVRDDELPELDGLKKDFAIFPIKVGVENASGKCNLLIQAYIGQARPRGFTLISDTAYVAQNAGRVARGLFEISLKRGWSHVAGRFLGISKAIDRRVWWTQHPLRQFSTVLPREIMMKLEGARKPPSLATLRDMSAREIGQLIRNTRMGDKVKHVVAQFPRMEVEVVVKPITRGILQVNVTLVPDFVWSNQHHGNVEPWWVWMEDGSNETIYHSEYFLLERKQHQAGEPIELAFTCPVFDPLPSQYHLRVVSDRWVGAETVHAVSFQHLILPEEHPPHTDLLHLDPLPVTALQNPNYEEIYSKKFAFFNTVQTQFFHTVYHTDRNVLLGAPTGSGKTVAAELSVMRLFSCHPGSKAVYIAPLKALARERLVDWGKKFGEKLGRQVVELTGDFTPDLGVLQRADIMVTTPEKWDGISRSWHRRGYVQKVGLIIIDEIHLLGEDRGPVLEVIVSRMRYISSQTQHPVRVVGLSTALANAKDLADWLGIDRVGLYNFKPSVRPVPLEAHIQGFPGKHYCPRMASMNKPSYAAIMTYSPAKPALVFVSSRRQTRLTALDLISFCAQDENPKQFLHMDPDEIDALCQGINDQALKHTLAFGIGIHHGGLKEHDRSVVEELFCNGKIQILVCTSTLAWGVNFPAHLVVIKGTEYYDGPTRRYKDFPITDVLQMMGRAGRPQFDDTGTAVILVHEPKKNFYKKFLYEPFPVESQLLGQLHDHINAEVAAGTIRHVLDCVDWLTWTYLYRRLVRNPSYYQLEDSSAEGVHHFLRDLAEGILRDLNDAGCIELGPEEEEEEDDDEGDEGVGEAESKAAGGKKGGFGGGGAGRADEDVAASMDAVRPLTLSYIASYYYVSYETASLFQERLLSLADDYDGAEPMEQVRVVALLLSDAAEFDELPVRHNEDKLNEELALSVRWEADSYSFDSPHVKTFLLLQAKFGGIDLPIADFYNDLKSVLDQAARVLNACIDIAADQGLLDLTVAGMHLAQMVNCSRFLDDSTLLQLPGMSMRAVEHLAANHGIECLPELLDAARRKPLQGLVGGVLSAGQARQVEAALQRVPVVDIDWEARALDASDGEDEGEGGGDAADAGDDAEGGGEGGEFSLAVTLTSSTGNSRAGGGGGGGGRGGRRGGGGGSNSGGGGGGGSKGKPNGWWLVLGDSNRELLAMKRVTLPANGTRKVDLLFEAGGGEELQLLLVCDSWAGLDQQYQVEV